MSEYRSEEERRKFAIERSHRDADKSNETIRATAQAAILINGGAATAILAFLSKDGIDSAVYHSAPLSLLGYALGVVAGFSAMYCSIRSLDEYQMRWSIEAHRGRGPRWQKHNARAFGWWKGMQACFAVSMAAFVAGSLVIAVSISRAPAPPKKAAIGSGFQSTAVSSRIPQSAPAPLVLVGSSVFSR
jgi:hypothetical protein